MTWSGAMVTTSSWYSHLFFLVPISLTLLGLHFALEKHKKRKCNEPSDQRSIQAFRGSDPVYKGIADVIRFSKPLPEWREVRVWRVSNNASLPVSVSTLAVSRDRLVFGTRSGRIVELDLGYKDPVKGESSKIGVNVDENWIHNTSSIKRIWSLDNDEIFDVARLDDKYVVVTTTGVSLVDDSGRKTLFSNRDGSYWSVAINKNKTAVFGMDNRKVRIVDMTSLLSEQNGDALLNISDVQLLYFGENEQVYMVSAMPDIGLAVGEHGAYLFKLWDPSPQPDCKYFLSANRVISGAVSECGTVLALAQSNGDIRIYEVPTATVVQTFSKHRSAVYSIAISSNGKIVASGSGGYSEADDYSVYVWESMTGTPLLHFTEHAQLVSAICLSRDGTVVTSASWDGTIRRVDLKFGERTRFLLFLMKAQYELPPEVLYLIFSFII